LELIRSRYKQIAGKLKCFVQRIPASLQVEAYHFCDFLVKELQIGIEEQSVVSMFQCLKPTLEHSFSFALFNESFNAYSLSQQEA